MLDSNRDMALGLSIHVVDPDEDYLGIDIRASIGRFVGTARIFAGGDQLSEFVAVVEGFPAGPDDRRRYEFGTRESGYAGGFVAITLRCVDRAGHAEVVVEIEDDAVYHSKASAALSFSIEPQELDRFVTALRAVEREGCGSTTLAAAL